MQKIYHYFKKFSVSVLTLLLIGLSVNLNINAQVGENAEAKQVAASFFKSRNPKVPGLKSAPSDPELKQIYRSSAQAETPLFVFQRQEAGFAMVAQSHDRCAVVGYSDEAVFPAERMPPQLVLLMKMYEDSLIFTRDDSETIRKAMPVVAPLLDKYGVRLNQFSHAEAGGCPTGCVATAVAQIMLYHAARTGRSVMGYGSKCYTDETHGEICADFSGIEYNSEELLSYHVGVSMEMQYCGSPYGSVPNKDFAPGLDEHFHYYTGQADSEDYFVLNELDHQRPVYVSLRGEPVGHAVVVDGCDEQGFYHVNFGWGGQFNGYYWLNSGKFISPGGYYTFSTNITAPRVISPSPIPVNPQDSLALVAIHHAMGGTAVTGWDLSKPVFTWPGVLLMNERVVKLSISSSRPPVSSQSIAPEIENLTGLRELWLSGCFNGLIPSGISRLTELRELNIHNSTVYDNETLHVGTLSGSLPFDIGNLTYLEWLSISNALEGTIPASIGTLTNLKLLRFYQDTTYFGKGRLTGSIPAEIGNLSQLQQLHISNQQLSGPLPGALGSLGELHDLDLSGNLLTGAVPNLTFPRLEYLKLNDNQFTEFSEGLMAYPLLKVFHLQNNHIQGGVPSALGNCKSLESLNLSNNQLESLPQEIGNLGRLTSMDVSVNQLKSLPDGIGLLNNLKHLKAASNQIGYLPGNLGQSRSFVTLDLSNNQITSIPAEIGNCPDISEIYLNDNLIDSIPKSFDYLNNVAAIYLHNNELKGYIPLSLLVADGNNTFVRLTGNRFSFEDIPASDALRFGVRDQKCVKLDKKIFKVQVGDTISIDIRSISKLAHPSNEYYWLSWPDLSQATTRDERFADVPNNPVLEFVVNAQNITKTYYCKVFNPDVPSFSFDYMGSTVTTACLDYLNTDTIVFELATDQEILAEKYVDEFVTTQTSLASMAQNSISDGTVTLVPPLAIKRGDIQWEASADGVNWEVVSESMERADLKTNIKSFNAQELVVTPKTNAYYRCGLVENNCAPLYSEPLQVKAQGNVLFDEVINVTEQPKTISVDSIEVIVPLNFHDDDFRLIITKLDNPPADPDTVVAGMAYDVTVSFGDTFELPLIIKLKNIDKTKVNASDINRFQAVYFDDKTREWKAYEHASISLRDSSMVILTNHLTKMKWWWYAEEYRSGFTDVYDRNNILVFFKDVDTDFINQYNTEQSAKPWHVPNVPLMVQDITEYLPEVMAEYKYLGLPVPEGKFKVYIEDLKGEEGSVGLLAMLQGFITVGRTMDSPIALRQTLAHEFMHYIQDDYISAHGGNQFWMEAHASLSDRIVWDDKVIAVCESEQFFNDGLKGKNNYTFNILADSWDAWDLSMAANKVYSFFKTEETLQYYYTAGTFLHYLRSYREKSEKLEPATLLKETSWLGSWRTYLAGYVNNHLNSVLGDEYEDFVRYVLSGKNDKFSLINKSGNPYAYIQDSKNTNVFTHPVAYRFKTGDEMVQKDHKKIKVPYLASKVVLLENQNPDTMVLVNYKRIHDFDPRHRVYHVTYDFQKKEMNFVDISDSAEYNLLLEARTEENVQKKFNNYSFLLLINKEYVGASSLIKDFDASFELTAMPVLNIEKVGMLNIYAGDSPVTHQFKSITTPGTYSSEYIMFGSPTAAFLQNNTGMDVQEIPGGTTKRMINDHTYQISSTFMLIIDQGFVTGKPTMKDSTVYIQTIEHDISTGILKISEHEQKYHKLHTFIEYYEEESGLYKERLVYGEHTDIIENKTKTYWLNGINSYLKSQVEADVFKEVYGDNIQYYKTDNTTQTQQLVEKIEANYTIANLNQDGSVASTEQWEYNSTDFSNSSLQLYFIFNASKQ